MFENEEQREKFSEILKLNSRFLEGLKEEEFYSKLRQYEALNQAQKELKEMMGDEKYWKFMNMGREMFATEED